MAFSSADRLGWPSKKSVESSGGRRNFCANQRVCDFDGCYGTVRYVGSLSIAGIASPADNNMWVGVEWDDPGRGKHDGQLKGKRFFQTSSPTGASFLQTNRLNAGIPADIAFRSRYTALGNRGYLSGVTATESNGEVPVENDGTAVNQQYDHPQCVSPSSIRSAESSTHLSIRSSNSSDLIVGSDRTRSSRSVELVGMKRSLENLVRYQAPKVVDIASSYVNDVEPGEPLSSLVPRCGELVLRNNLLSAFDTISNILDGFNELHTLDVSGNVFTTSKEFLTPQSTTRRHKQQQQHSSYGANLRTLVADRCKLTWLDVEQLLSVFNKLERLIVGHNLIDNISCSRVGAACFESLQYLDLQYNQLTAWAAFSIFSTLPSLSNFNASFNKLTVVTIADATLSNAAISAESVSTVPLWLSLETLALRGNQISDWQSVSELRKIFCLRSLVISQNPVLDNCDENRPTAAAAVEIDSDSLPREKQKPLSSLPNDRSRLWVIAKLPQLEKLNNSLITDEERKSAELIYARHYGPHWASLTVGGAEERLFCVQHPTFLDLCSKHHFTREEFLPQNGGAKSLKMSDRLIKVEFLLEPAVLNGGADNASLKVIAIAPSMSIAKLKRLVEKKFALKGSIVLKIPHETRTLMLNADNDAVSAAAQDFVDVAGVTAARHDFGDAAPENEVTKKTTLLELDKEQAEVNFYNIKNGDRVIVQQR